MTPLLDAYKLLEAEHKDYYGKYTFDRPVCVTSSTSDNLQFAQLSLVKCLRYLAANFDAYAHMMPVSEKERAILKLADKKPYESGTYRTDFIVTEDNQIKLIEITCRFALNGFIRSGFVNVWGDKFAQDNQLPFIDHYSDFFAELELYFSGHETIYLLKDDSYNEGRYIRQLFDYAGYNLIVLTLEEIPFHIDLIRKSACISQLTHEELLSFPMDVIEAIVDSRLLNDMRTVFLAHDKRFFAVMCDVDFRNKALGEKDSERFKQFLAPTYTKKFHADLWEKIRKEKDEWIVKIPNNGRSIGISAGYLLTEEEWQQALDELSAQDAVFQPFFKQKLIEGLVGEEVRAKNYIAGTLLYFQDKCFGMGMFRVSNHPVTNKGDDRKLAACHLTTNNLPVYIARENDLIL